MICSGEQTNFLYKVHEEDLSTIKNLIEALEQNKNGVVEISSSGLKYSSNESIPENFFFEMESEENWRYKERVGYKNHLYIIGGGHCSLTFSKIMSMMDFYICLFVNSYNLNTFEEKIFVKKTRLI